jgi:hypothetical protein
MARVPYRANPSFRNVATNPTIPTYDINIGGPYGEMPFDALMSKFEETDDGYTEEKMINAMRMTLVDRSPDPASLASDEPRKTYAPYGFLNLIHSGNRSGEDPNHPEINLDDDWKDPRRQMMDPDMTLYAQQNKLRTERYKSFYADADNSITGGNWNENQILAGRIKTRELTRPRFRQFRTSYDGRREGMRRTYENVSSVRKTVKEPGDWTDIIKDWALNPQRKTTILSNKMIARSRAYQQNTTDHDFSVAKYGQDMRRRKLVVDQNPLEYADTDNRFCDGDKSTVYKSVGVLMGDITKQKHDACKDSDDTESQQTQSRKHSNYAADMQALLRQISADANMNDVIKNQPRKRPAPHPLVSKVGKNVEDQEHDVVLHNALTLFKTAKRDKNLRKAQDKVITDAKAAVVRLQAAHSHQLSWMRIPLVNCMARLPSALMYIRHRRGSSPRVEWGPLRRRSLVCSQIRPLLRRVHLQ